MRDLWLLLLLVLILAACGPPEDSSWTRITTIDGKPAAIDDGYFRHLITTDDGVTWTAASYNMELGEFEVAGPELCLAADRSVCVRTIEQRVEESDDGGSSWETVWELDLSGNWLTRQLDTFEEARIQPGSVLETPSGAVLAAVGSAQPIRRSVNGEWSPTEGDLRIFPRQGALLATVGLLALIVALAARPVPIGVAATGAVVIAVASFALHQPTERAAIFSAPLIAITAFGWMSALVESAFADPVVGERRHWNLPAPFQLAPVAVLNLGLGAWSQGWLGWQIVVLSTAAITSAAMIVSIVAAAKDHRERRPTDVSAGNETPSVLAPRAPRELEFPSSAVVLSTFGIAVLPLGFLFGPLLIAALANRLSRSGRRLQNWELRISAAVLTSLVSSVFIDQPLRLLQLAVILALLLYGDAPAPPAPTAPAPTELGVHQKDPR